MIKNEVDEKEDNLESEERKRKEYRKSRPSKGIKSKLKARYRLKEEGKSEDIKKKKRWIKGRIREY